MHRTVSRAISSSSSVQLRAGRVDRHAGPLETRADACADLGGVLADTAGKDEGVRSAHRSQV
jgi:hypothetical protein